MAWSIIYEGYSKRPLSQKEVGLVEAHVRKWNQNDEWEGENYAPEVQQMASETEPNERRLVIWGSTAPDGTMDEVVLQAERILSALTELKKLLPQVEWEIVAGEEEVQWDEERQKFVIPTGHDYQLIELPAEQKTAPADEIEAPSFNLMNTLVEQLSCFFDNRLSKKQKY